MNMSVESAYRRSLETVMDWIGSQVNTSKTYVLFRTYSAVHFRFSLSPSSGSFIDIYFIIYLHHIKTQFELPMSPVYN